jgi:nucleotide-binding universal stress UspA family protein
MTRISRILIAVDRSQVSRSAFRYALALGQRYGAEVVAVHVVPRTQAFDQHAAARRDLASALRREAVEAGVALTLRVQHGDPADTVLLHVRTLRPDLIVLGTHQRRGLQRLRTGSIAERIAARVSVPVLVVPPDRRRGGSRPFRHVAVAVDFSAASGRAFDRAQEVADDPGDRITLLHVVPGFPGGMPPHYYRYGQAEYQIGLVQDARQRLERIVAAERRTPATIEVKVLVGDAATEISRVVDGIGADLLVAGVPKRSRASRAVFGTTARRLARRLRVPLLAVPETTPIVRPEPTSLQPAA